MGEYREEGAITKTLGTLALTEKTEALLQQERQYVRGGFEPGPAFFERAKGSKLWVRNRFSGRRCSCRRTFVPDVEMADTIR